MDQSLPAGTPQGRARLHGSTPGLPVVRVATAVASPGLAACLTAFDEVAVSSGRGALDDLDLAVIEPAEMRKLPVEGRDALARWAAQAGRPPIVVWADGEVDDIEDLAALLRPGDVLAATSQSRAEELRCATGLESRLLSPSFDPAVANPLNRRDQALPEDPLAARHVVVEDGRPLAVVGASKMLAAPPAWLLQLAASGVPLDPGVGTEERDRASVAARRWAYRLHAPWVRARELLALAGVDAPDPDPTVAGVLVSKRARSVSRAISGFLRQTYHKVELVVGLHGPGSITQIERLATDSSVPTTVVHFDDRTSLGECLNRAIAATSAEVLAKIDDDDHYGPGFVEDGVHALAYSGADIVGKATQLTYLRGRDLTVVRHPGLEETFVDESPRGASLLVRREAWRQVQFPHRPRGVDRRFIQGARRVGASVYANSRWEFCFARADDDAVDAVELAGAEPAWEGFQPERAEVPDVAVPV